MVRHDRAEKQFSVNAPFRHYRSPAGGIWGISALGSSRLVAKREKGEE
jgi:hypothetical protein